MKEGFLGLMLLTLSWLVPSAALAAVDIRIGISLPPPFVISAPPVVIAMPETADVYVVPDIDADIFFWSGWWWMPWEGRWYRSSHYDRGWVYYNRIPAFYYDVDPDWRRHYHNRDWYGHRWDYDRISHQQLTRNWKEWQKNRHWERQRIWGIQNYRPRPKQQRQELWQQRERQYQQRPEVQRQQPPRQEPIQRIQPSGQRMQGPPPRQKDRQPQGKIKGREWERGR